MVFTSDGSGEEEAEQVRCQSSKVGSDEEGGSAVGKSAGVCRVHTGCGNQDRSRREWCRHTTDRKELAGMTGQMDGAGRPIGRQRH